MNTGKSLRSQETLMRSNTEDSISTLIEELAALAIVAASSVILVDIGVQPAEAGSDANCPSKSGAATTIDPNAPNAVNSNTPLTAQSIV
jgi:hypothetical protein